MRMATKEENKNQTWCCLSENDDHDEWWIIWILISISSRNPLSPLTMPNCSNQLRKTASPAVSLRSGNECVKAKKTWHRNCVWERESSNWAWSPCPARNLGQSKIVQLYWSHTSAALFKRENLSMESRHANIPWNIRLADSNRTFQNSGEYSIMGKGDGLMKVAIIKMI